LKLMNVFATKFTLTVLSLIGVFSNAQNAEAAQAVKFKSGVFGISVQTTELQNFVRTGVTTSKIDFFLKKLNLTEEQAIGFLGMQLETDLVEVSDLLNSPAGVAILEKVAKAIHGPTQAGAVQALRAAVVLSAVDNNHLSLLEVIQKYPLQDMVVDASALKGLKDELGSLFP
jgi:hypothetical protein